jgi:hypothetical protein
LIATAAYDRSTNLQMSDQTIIHAIRQRIGITRQPPHSDDLRELHTLLTALGVSHPYELDYTQRVTLETNRAYAQGGRGPSATVPSDGFLYRIASAKAVAYGVDELTLGGITEDDNEDVIWNAYNDIADPDKWRSLSRYARGDLIGRRGVTWWTSLVLSRDNVVAGAYKMGMYGLWIPVYALLLRCPVKFLLTDGDPLVPTVLDAFDQEVFYPTKYSDGPTCGITISLEHSGSVATGTHEFILSPVPVKKIEILPVFVDAATRVGHDPIEQCPEGWGLLANYLDNL